MRAITAGEWQRSVSQLFLCGGVSVSSNSLLRPETMYSIRAASLTATLVIFVSAFGGSVPVRGQAARTGRRDIEQYRGRRVMAGEVLVRFRGVPSTQSMAGLDLTDNERLLGGIRRLRARQGGVAALVAALSVRPDVEYVEPNYLIEPTAVPSDPYFPYQVGLFNATHPGADLHAPTAWDVATGSRVGVVALIDSGVDYTHPDLVDNLWSAPAPFTVTIAGVQVTCPAGTHGFNAIALTCDPMDAQGHGTAMAGIIGADGNNGSGVSGVNWSASILPIKFIDGDGVGNYGDAIRAIDFAIQINDAFGASAGAVQVLSASWRGTMASQALADAVERANAHGMLLVAAAGNDGLDIDASPVYPAGLTSANVVAVAASSTEDSREGYSNYGLTSVDLAAPGTTYTTQLGGGYAAVGGTSASAAFVSGAAALLLSRCALDTPQLRALLLGTVDVVDGLGAASATGGRINLQRALASCSGTNVAPSVAVVRPAQSQALVEQDAVEIDADAFDVDGTIASVDFFVGSTWIGRDVSAPFSLATGPWPAGSYPITAVATDDRGARTTSAAVWVTVRSLAVTLPAPWQVQDVGATGAAGQAFGSTTAMSVSGAGADVWGTADALTYVYQPLSGDGEIVARVASIESVASWTKAGVMLRTSLAADAAQAFMLGSAAKGIAYQRRLVGGGDSVSTSGGDASAPVWVKLARSGQTITASASADGSSWTVVGTDTVAWPATVFAGIAVSSHRTGVLATADVDSIAVAQAPSSPAMSAILPQGWTGVDVGAVGVAGSATFQDGVFALNGAGADIWDSTDAFQFVYTTLIGDGQVTAHVAALAGVAPWTKAGVMMRATLDPHSAHGYALVSFEQGAAFQRRLETGAASLHTDGGGLSAPAWVRLVRVGQTVTASTSIDGQTWNVTASDTIPLGVTAFVGLAITSHDQAQLASAMFDQVSVTAFTAPPNPPVARPLPSGWASGDVGAVGTSGSAREDGGAFIVSGSGLDVWGTEDAFQFAYTTLQGDGTITARVASVDALHAWTKAGVMLRQSLDPSAPQAFSLVSAAKGQAFQRRPAFGTVSTHTPGPLAAAPLWVRLTRAGTTVTALTSFDGISWSVVGTDTIAFSGPIYAGLAVSSHDATAVATAVFTDVRIGP
jgi:regulation of enolase protein 1 (concanavalin A-like superfamily)